MGSVNPKGVFIVTALLSCAIVAAVFSVHRVHQGFRGPAAIPGSVAKSLLGGILGEARGLSEQTLAEWLLSSKVAHDLPEALLVAKRLRVNVAAISRAELDGNPELRQLLLKDLGELGPQDIARLQAWSNARFLRLAGAGEADRAAKQAIEVQRVLQRSLIPTAEGRQELRRAAIEFIENSQPKVLEGVLDQESLIEAVQIARLHEIPEEQAVEFLQTMNVMIGYHGTDWDAVRSVKRLRELKVDELRQVRAAYREALINGSVDPNLVALSGKLAPVPRMVTEQEFANKRDSYLKIIDRMRWFTSNPVRATEQDLQRLITEFDYLIRLGDKKAARAAIQSKFLAVETSTLYVRRLRAMLSEALGRQAGAAEVERLERMLAQQEKILGTHFEEYRALRQHLADLMGARSGFCDAPCSRFASEIESSAGLTDLHMKSFVVSFEGMSRPTLQEVSDTFYSSTTAQVQSLRRTMFVEVRSTLLTMASSLVMIQEFQRLAARVPELGPKFRWTRGVLFFLYDTRARQIHFPQLSRIFRAQGGAAEQIQMLEQMALPPNDDLLVTFARRMDQDYRELWRSLKSQAQARFESGAEGGERSASLIARMEEAEKSAISLGGISVHFEHSPAVKLGALIVAGYGGYAWYQGGDTHQRIEEIGRELGGLSDASRKHGDEDSKASGNNESMELALSTDVLDFLERVKRLPPAHP
ncbi:MAG: hypothetical protein KGQ59_01570 [Bdellovibrionales bacterium]|nr:hypothetical protein [Bdellovibrionales bacterium]